MARELSVTIADREHSAAVERDEGRFRVTIDGAEHLVDAVRVGGSTWSLLIEGRSYLVDLDQRGPRQLVLAGGAEHAVELVDARRKALAAAVGAGETQTGEIVRAPIAGRVVKLLVEPGAEVAAGQGVIVLEAMKMENEIKAARGGTVATIHTEAGVPVETGETLVTLE